MEKKQFQAESKRLLDLMINSIYTHREVFLRELISNASDAIDKIYYKTLTDESLTFDQDSYYIKIEADKENRILKITDTGIVLLETNFPKLEKICLEEAGITDRAITYLDTHSTLKEIDLINCKKLSDEKIASLEGNSKIKVYFF